MALYHVKNGFTYVLQFFSLISDGLGGVSVLVRVLTQVKVKVCAACIMCSRSFAKNIYLATVNSKYLAFLWC